MTHFTNPSFVWDLIREHDFKIKKRFGQNFLIDQNILQKITAAAGLEAEDWVLEIGPGLGALTVAAASKVQKVVALEIDFSLLAILRKILTATNVVLIQGDALILDWQAILCQAGWVDQPLKLVANLPYYLTTPLLMKALQSELPFADLVVMVQKEVGLRMVARPNSGDFGVLSLMVQYYTEASLVSSVPRTVFLPAPEVDSALVHLKPRIPPVDVPYIPLFAVIKASFQQRRKTVRNALKPLIEEWNLSIEDLDEALFRAKIDPSWRGERLALSDFGELTRQLLKGVETDGIY